MIVWAKTGWLELPKWGKLTEQNITKNFHKQVELCLTCHSNSLFHTHRRNSLSYSMITNSLYPSFPSYSFYHCPSFFYVFSLFPSFCIQLFNEFSAHAVFCSVLLQYPLYFFFAVCIITFYWSSYRSIFGSNLFKKLCFLCVMFFFLSFPFSCFTFLHLTILFLSFINLPIKIWLFYNSNKFIFLTFSFMPVQFSCTLRYAYGIMFLFWDTHSCYVSCFPYLLFLLFSFCFLLLFKSLSLSLLPFGFLFCFSLHFLLFSSFTFLLSAQ